MDLVSDSLAIPARVETGSARLMAFHGLPPLGPSRDPIDPKAVKIGAEQAEDRAIKPWDEAQFILSRIWASASSPIRRLGRLMTHRSAGEDS